MGRITDDTLGALANLGDLFAYRARDCDGSAAIVQQDHALSFAQVWDEAGALAGFLQQVCGVEPGDRVALMLSNRPEFAVATAAIHAIGAVQVNINPHYVARELHHQLVDSGAGTIILSGREMAVLRAANADCVCHAVVIDAENVETSPGLALASYVEAVAAGMSFVPSRRGRDDLALLQYTGGTTGRAKGAMLSHGNLLSNIAQFTGWIEGGLKETGLGGVPPVVLTAIPLYHIFALTVNLLGTWAMGGRNVLIRDTRDVALLSEEWSRHGVSFVTGVNTLYKALLASPEFAGLDLSQGVVAMGGGAPVQRPVSDRWNERTGRHIIEGYGLSETSPILTCTPFFERRFLGSIGQALPGTRIAIRDEFGQDLPIGETGELCASGPQVMQGYWRQPEATAQVLGEDGFLRTGDLARRDEEGNYYILDRAKDMILVSGFNVYPNEIEETVSALPGVVECACVGAPDPKSGEAAVLFVVADPAALDEAAVLGHCRANLTGYKVPRRVFVVREIPKSAVGKILRRKLRDAAPAMLAGEVPSEPVRAA
jgi:long-chain acyl-CoA synthetase